MGRILYCYGCGAEVEVSSGPIRACAYCGTKRLATHKPTNAVMAPSARPALVFTKADAEFLRALRIKAE